MTEQLAIEIIPSNRLLIAAEFHRLADVPPEIERFANIRNSSTRRAYEAAIRDFMQFTGIDDRLCEVFPSRGPRRSMARSRSPPSPSTRAFSGCSDKAGSTPAERERGQAALSE